jgi:thiosulfate/3-mercaptopyruvate sulfurtransferase
MKKYNSIIKYVYKGISLTHKPIIDAKQVHEVIGEKDVKILDCTLLNHFDKTGRVTGIPTAQYFDLEQLSGNKELPFMLPSNEGFSTYIGKYNIQPSDSIICYDQHETLYSSARVWFTFKLFGFKNVYVINGGLNGWSRYGYSTDLISKPTIEAAYDSHLYKKSDDKILSFEEMVMFIHKLNNEQSQDIIIDTRHPDRFNGSIDEPREFRRLGHIANSINLYYKDLLCLDTNKLKSENELLEKFNSLDVDFDNQNVIFYSGAGISACLGILAMDTLGKFEKAKLYDGSWAEYVISNNFRVM